MHSSESTNRTEREKEDVIRDINNGFDGVMNLAEADRKPMYTKYMNELSKVCYDMLQYLGYDIYDSTYGFYSIYDRRTNNSVSHKQYPQQIIDVCRGEWTSRGTGDRIGIFFILEKYEMEPKFRLK